MAAVSAVPLYLLANRVLTNAAVLNFGFFYILTVTSFFLVMRYSKIPGNMVNAFLGRTVAVLLVAVVYLLLVLRKFHGNETGFTITFFAAYLICTGFEVYYILYNLREI
jgi:hypothetical protein